MLLHLFGLCLAALSPAATLDDVLPCTELAYGAIAATCDDEGECDERLAALVVVTGARETRGRAGAVGDNGLARGRFQLHPEWRPGVSGDELDVDPVLDARLAAAALRALERSCGSRFGAVCAYASGSCGRAVDVARRRCDLAGGC